MSQSSHRKNQNKKKTTTTTKKTRQKTHKQVSLPNERKPCSLNFRHVLLSPANVNKRGKKKLPRKELRI